MGVTATWQTTNGDWFSAANWSESNPDGSSNALHYVPTADNDVVFNGPGPYTVTYNGTDSVDGIYDVAQTVTLAITGGSLTVGADGGDLGTLSTAVGASFALADSSSFRIVTAIDNAGTIALNAGADTTRLTIGVQTSSSPVSLTGGGNITLSDSANNSIFIDNSASLDNVDNTISGAGSIGSNSASLINEAKGVIDATGTLNSLVLSVPNVTNEGLIEATGAGALQLSNSGVSTTIANAGGTIAANGAGAHVDIGYGTKIAGGTLSTSGGGVIEVINNANGNILDGTDADGSLTITAGSTVQLEDGAALELAGTTASTGVIVNHGTIALDAGADKTQLSGTGGGTTMLTGGGQIILSDSANNLIGGGDFGTVFDNVDNTISGAGVIDSVAGRLSLTNEAKGVIDATGTNNALSVQNITVTNAGLIEDTGQAGLTIADATIDNAGGTIAAVGAGTHVDLVDNGIGTTTIVGGTLTTSGGGVINVTNSTASLEGSVLVTGAVAGAGTLAIASGDTTFASGATLTTSNLRVAGGAEAEIATSLTYAGGLANSGTVTLDGANTLELSGAVSGSGTISFASGAAATLQLDESALPDGETFSNTVTAFAPGDVIDLRGVGFQGDATATYDASTGTLSVTEGTVTDTLNLVAPGATSFVAQSDGFGGTEIVVVCFGSGTRIRTPRGDVAVEHLGVGDLVVTASGAHRPICWLGHREIVCRRHRDRGAVFPIRIAAHAFGERRPGRDLYVSPGHSLCIDVLGEMLVPARALVNGTTIAQIEVERVTYWHVELDSHDILLAENLAAESYLDMGNRAFFAERDLVLLDPAPDGPLRTHADFCRPFAADGALVEAARMRLEARARSLAVRREAATVAA